MKDDNKILVIKIGTSSLTNPKGDLDDGKIDLFVKQVVEIHKTHQLVIVTSGAIAAGFRKLGYQNRPTTTSGKQASAAVGQGYLMQAYTKRLEAAGILCAQILLTRDDFYDKRRYQNAYSTLRALLSKKVIPIINENDTVAIEELHFGDNDTLSAQVAAMIHAHQLLILTDVDGLYTGDPTKDPNAKKIDQVVTIDHNIEAMAKPTSNKNATGGMLSKIHAARIATRCGVEVIITTIKNKQSLIELLKNPSLGTCFLPQASSLSLKRQWLSYYSQIKGTIIVDQGAALALTQRQTSLLPKGIVEVRGVFLKGDCVEVLDEKLQPLGRGLSAYNSEQLNRIIGLNSEAIAKVFPRGKKVAIHRDDWLEEGRIKHE
ncbi:MAG: glutamate 5-kinase [Erysipelotrichaceae bacterium]|jgi:glutamate 5-kinase|nr:glutamate 5-kinase [Erysipelotrichaceae bacterium]